MPRGAHSDRINDVRKAAKSTTTGTKPRVDEAPDPLALEKFLCPVMNDPQTGQMGRHITQVTCQNYCSSRDRNVRCMVRNCESPWRFCKACLYQVGFDRATAIVVDPKNGLCAFHEKHGEDARKPLPEDVRRRFADTIPPPAPKKEEVPKPRVQAAVAAPLVLSGGNGKFHSAPLPPAQTIQIPKEVLEVEDLTVDTSVYRIPRDSIRPFEDQPRKYFDEAELLALAESIAEVGQRDPITVCRRVGDPTFKFQLIDGERRLRACGLKDISFMRAIIDDGVHNENEQFEVSVIANFCREGHTELEEGAAVKRMIDNGRNAEQVAKRLGKSIFWVHQRMKLLTLDPEVKALMHPTLPKKERLKATVAYALTPYSHEFQREHAKYIVKHELTLSRALAYIRKEAELAGHPVMIGKKRRVPSDDFVLLEAFLDRVLWEEF